TWVQSNSGFFQWSNAAASPDGDNWAKDNGGGSWTTPTAGANGIGSTARIVAKVPTGLVNAGTDIQGQTITISDLSKTLGHLVIDNPNSFTITSATTALNINMQVYSGSADITVLQGSHTISTGSTGAGGGMTFTSPTNVTISPGAMLTTRAITNTGGM